MAFFTDFFSKLFGGASSSTPAESTSPASSSSPLSGTTPPASPSTLADTLNLSANETPWLIVGLGNPGARYETTRHNIGYMAVDHLLDDIADKTSSAAMLLPEKSLNSLIFATRLRANGTNSPSSTAPEGSASESASPGTTISESTEPGTPVIVARANTYMNLSGDSIGAIAQEFGIPSEKIVIIHDELDLKPGQVRIKVGGGENGHNGLKSTTDNLGTRDYVRIRMGIGRPPQGTGVVEHVLASFSEEEAETWLPQAVANAAEGAYLIATKGLSAAQNHANQKR